MKSKKERDLTPQEKYDFDYAKGYRTGRITASRSMVIHALKHFGKPSRVLLRKVSYEVDCQLLAEIICRIADKTLTVEKLESIYDTIIPKELGIGEDVE